MQVPEWVPMEGSDAGNGVAVGVTQDQGAQEQSINT
jgi:hypothetical protein